MNEQPKIDLEHYSSEGMPTIPLRPMPTTANINRIYAICIVLVVALLVIDHATIESLIATYILPQLVFCIGLIVLAFVLAIVRRWYWLCIAAVAFGAVLVGLPWLNVFGGAILGLLIGVAFLLVYGIGRIWFDYSEPWPFIASGVATAYAMLAILAKTAVLPEILVLPVVLLGVGVLFALQLRRQKVI
jgi:hypothetical protein